MLSIRAGTSSRNCDGPSRRDCLRVGTLALGGLTLSQLLETNALASGRTSFVRDKSVVLLYLSGGASHIETFDPKMTAPAGIRSVTGEVKSPIPGVAFGGTFPEMAKHADKMAIVRSFTHSVASHEQAHVHVLSGGTDPRGQQKQGFSMGASATRLRGAHHPVTGMPTYALLTESEIDGQYQKEIGRVRKGSWPGSLGRMFAPLEHQLGWQREGPPGSVPMSRPVGSERANPLLADMHLNLPAEQLNSRLQLLGSIDKLKRHLDNTGAMESLDRFSTQALDLVLGGAADAFDVAQESNRLVERYDTSHIRIGHKRFRPSTLGRQMLVARRLCEAGCGFVTVHSAGWDMHADGNNPGIKLGMEMLGRSLDKAVSAFLEDVGRRGLSEKILLVITGDFGRTPKVNQRGGRDHWAKLGTLAFAGGGLNMGQVIGTSAPTVDEATSHPVSTPELMATVLHTMFDVGRLRLESGVPGELARLVQAGRPIEQLF